MYGIFNTNEHKTISRDDLLHFLNEIRTNSIEMQQCSQFKMFFIEIFSMHTPQHKHCGWSSISHAQFSTTMLTSATKSYMLWHYDQNDLIFIVLMRLTFLLPLSLWSNNTTAVLFTFQLWYEQMWKNNFISLTDTSVYCCAI